MKCSLPWIGPFFLPNDLETLLQLVFKRDDEGSEEGHKSSRLRNRPRADEANFTSDVFYNSDPPYAYDVDEYQGHSPMNDTMTEEPNLVTSNEKFFLLEYFALLFLFI